MTIIRRSEWRARPPRRRSTNISPISVTAHWGGPSPWPGHDFNDHNHCYSTVRSWQNFHMDGRGWSDIAYSGLVCPHGYVFEGRGPNIRTAANGTNSGNQNSYALCYIGGVGDKLTNQAKLAYLEGARWLGVPLNKVHGDWKRTACPGPEISAWVRSGAIAPGDAFSKPPPTAIIAHEALGADMYVAISGVGFFAQVGDVSVPLEGMTLAEFGELTKKSSAPVMIIPERAAADAVNKMMLQTASATR